MTRAFSLAALLALALIGAVLTMGRLAPGAIGDQRLPAVSTPSLAVRSVRVSLPRPATPPVLYRRPQAVPPVARPIPASAPAVRRRPAPAPAAPRATPPTKRVGHHSDTGQSRPHDVQPPQPLPAPQTPAAPAQPTMPPPSETTPTAVKVEPSIPALPQDLPVVTEALSGSHGERHRDTGRVDN